MNVAHWKDHLDPEAPAGRYLPWKEVGRATGLSRTTAWRLQRRGDFPQAYTISPGRVGFLECEVEAWKASRRVEPGVVRQPMRQAATRDRSPKGIEPAKTVGSPARDREPVARQGAPPRRRDGAADERQMTLDL